MIATIETVFLGSAKRVSQKGTEYTVLTFMDEGEAVNAILSKDFQGELPKPLSPVVLDVHVVLGRYQKIEVLSIGC